ncbi:hypothetical protein Stsp01_46680 [Streptomyces sp. NBRC 13847]|nr:hypothetical protein Stsp01_46680 [Streptomyces sp. NBRC 13847]
MGAFAFGGDGDGADVGDLYQHNVSHGAGGMVLICSAEGLPPDRPTIRCNVRQNGRERLRWP